MTTLKLLEVEFAEVGLFLPRVPFPPRAAADDDVFVRLFSLLSAECAA